MLFNCGTVQSLSENFDSFSIEKLISFKKYLLKTSRKKLFHHLIDNK